MLKRLSNNEVSMESHVSAQLITIKWFRKVIDTATRVAHKPSRRVHIIVVGDKKMRSLNSIYRHKNKTTDVLSFPALEVSPQEKKQGVSLVYNDPHYLGEIILCFPQLRRQAREYKVPFQAEAARMTIHGFLHLWGYDHIKPKDARIMMPLQEKALAKI